MSTLKDAKAPQAKRQKLRILSHEKSAAVHDKVVKCWDPVKNELKPHQVTKSSGDKYWLNCDKCKHPFDITMGHVTEGKWCPYCAGKKLCGDDTCDYCLQRSAAFNKRVVACWHDKNKLKPCQVPIGSGKKFWLKCDNDKCLHSFDIVMYDVTRTDEKQSWCPYCSVPCKKLCGDDKCDQCFQKSAASHPNPKVLQFWDYDKNKLKPNQVPKAGSKKVWFKCDKCPHSFDIIMPSVSRGVWCRFCAGKDLCGDEDCLICTPKSAACIPQAVKCWDHSKNKLKPHEVPKFSNKKVWFKCDTCPHSFDMMMTGVSNGGWCRFCAHQDRCGDISCKFCNEHSAAGIPRVLECWDYDKNKLKPHEVAKFAKEKFWFKGDTCEHSFDMCTGSIFNGNWCRHCKNKTEAKAYAMLIAEYGEANVVKEFKAEWNRNPDNEKHCHLPFDFCVGNLMLEIDGRQHFEPVAYWESDPADIQKRDRLKEDLAIANGYSVYRVLQEDVWNDKIDLILEVKSALEHHALFGPDVIPKY